MAPQAPAPTNDIDPIFLQEEGKDDISGEHIFDLSSRYIFNRDHHKIYIRIHQRVFDKVLHDGANDIDSGWGLIDELCLDQYKVKQVGIKVRGNTSAANEKRQFKFKFDAEEVFAWRDGGIKDIELSGQDDRRFFGEQGFSVRASKNDPSRIREMLSGKVFREAALGKKDIQRTWRNDGGLVYRSAFATLYVTNGRTEEEGYDSSYPGYRVPFEGRLYDPKGLYIITENIDKTFIRTRFERYPNESVKGYLYQADKALASFEKEKYTREGWKLEMVKGKKPKDEEDHAKADEKMFDLLGFLASKPTGEEIMSRFDMDSLNAYLTAAVLTTHWDSLAANRNNDFMFYLKRAILDESMNPVLDEQGEKVTEKKWYMITWDLDNTLWDQNGVDNDVRNPYKNWFSNYLYQPARKDNRKTRLIEVIFNNESLKNIRQIYDGLLQKMLETFYSQTTYEQEVDSLSRRVEKAIEDTRRAVSEAGWQREWGEYHNPRDYEDIKAHARVRRDKVLSQLN